jgi:hypothetical protein
MAASTSLRLMVCTGSAVGEGTSRRLAARILRSRASRALRARKRARASSAC